MELSPQTFLTAYTDGTLQLPCKPYQYNTMKVKWFHYDKEITDESTLKDGSRISILPDGYLEISKIERSNAGTGIHVPRERPTGHIIVGTSLDRKWSYTGII